MPLLALLLGHDHWTTRRLLLLSRGLPDEALDRDFDIGRRTLRATFQHVVWNVEAWTDQMRGVPVRENAGLRPEGLTIDALIARLDAAAADLAALARTISERGAWSERWLDTLATPPVERTYVGTIAHVVTHGMHHRAQLLYMLRRVGVENLPEGDVLSYEAIVRGG